VTVDWMEPLDGAVGWSRGICRQFGMWVGTRVWTGFGGLKLFVTLGALGPGPCDGRWGCIGRVGFVLPSRLKSRKYGASGGRVVPLFYHQYIFSSISDVYAKSTLSLIV
jgi:hypothetical protein